MMPFYFLWLTQFVNHNSLYELNQDQSYNCYIHAVDTALTGASFAGGIIMTT